MGSKGYEHVNVCVFYSTRIDIVEFQAAFKDPAKSFV